MPPAGYHISEEDGLITVRVDQTIDMANLYESARLLLDDNAYDPELPLLVDLRGMKLRLSRQGLEPFNQFVISNYGAGRASIAIVIDPNMHRTLCAAIYWMACALQRTELFDDYDSALKWLIRREFMGSKEPWATLSTQAAVTPAGGK